MTILRRCTKTVVPEPTQVEFDGDLAVWKSYEPQISFLIIATAKYLVFIDREGDLDWSTNDEPDKPWSFAGDIHFNAVLNRVATLETTPCPGLPADMKRHFKRLVGEGISRAMEADYVGAQQILDSALAYIIARSQETSRRWYLSASSLMAFALIIVGVLLWVFRAWFTEQIGTGAFWIALASVAGSMGALLSVIGRTGKMRYDCASGIQLHYLEGASRIWAGALSGFLVGIAVRAGLILSALASNGRMPAIMIAAAMASGASERLANSIIVDLGNAKAVKTPEAEKDE
ncbi:MAG TPA: hypothetical protein VH020_14720 [Stellaceae bacterium]|nr:hypothetical protein [Stellaceae bacterium]